jgi:hypothetical protein
VTVIAKDKEITCLTKLLKTHYLVMFWGILLQGFLDMFQFILDTLEFKIARAL